MPPTSAAEPPGADSHRRPRDELFGHPKGLYVCFFTEMWERFSFYGMKALLALYLIKHHGFTDAQGLAVVGAFGGLSAALPVLGGILADRFLGMRKTVTLGAILLSFGHLGMSLQGTAARIGPGGVLQRDEGALAVFYLSLALIIVGVGLLKPNITVMVGKLYGDGDPRRDAGFTLFYAGINIGVLFASLVCGYLGEVFGWHYGFGAAGLGMLAGLTVFQTGRKHLEGSAEPPDPIALKRRIAGPLTLEGAIYLGTLLTLPLVWALMRLGTAVLVFQVALLLAWLAWFGWYLAVRCNRIQRHRMLACAFFMVLCFPYFVLSGQAYGSWILFTDRMLDKDLIPALVVRTGHPLPWSLLALVASPFLVALALRIRSARAARFLATVAGSLALTGIVHDSLALPQTASSLTYLYALLLVLLSPVMVWLWPFLKRHDRDPSRAQRSVIGIAFGALAFLPLAMAAEQAGASGQVSSVWWLVLAYLLLEIGDVLLAPASLAAVTELSMPQVVGLMMGARWLSTSLAAQLAAYVGSLAAIDVPLGGKLDWTQAAGTYASLFWNTAWLGLGLAAVTALAVPVIRRWTQDGASST